MKKIVLLGSMILVFVSFIQAQLITEGFETGFVNYQSTTGSTNQFTQDSLIFHSGTKSAHDTYVSNSTDTLLQTTVVDLTTTVTPQLIFWHICKTEGTYDFGYVYISTDSGATFSVLPTSTYLGTSSYSGSFDEDSYPLWGTSGTDTVKNTWWKRESFNLSAYTAFDKVMIMFVFTSDGSIEREGWYIDDISIENVSCPSVTGITDFGTFSDTTNITWISGPSDSLFDVQYGLAGFTLGTGTSTGFSTNDSVGIGSLSSNTSYDFYVRSICKSGDTSAWQGPYTLTTLCNPFTPTYTEDFATMTFAVTPSCWDKAQGLITDSSALIYGGTSYWNGRQFANVTGASNAAYLNLYSTNKNDWLISPTIDLGTGTLPYQVEFDIAFTDYANAAASAAGLGVDDTIALVISTDNGVTWSDTNILMLWNSSNMAPSFSGQFVAVNLTSLGYSGLIRLAFYAQSTVFNEDNDLFIDNFAVRFVPTCPRPLNFRTTSLFSDSVNLTWDTASSDGPYQLEFGTPGFVLGSGTSASSINDTTFINGLSPNTTYDVYLRTICSVGDTSFWTGPLQFTTPCASFLAPYLEDFSTYSFSSIPTCWEEANGLLTVASTLSMGSSEWTNDDFGNVFGNSNSARMNIWFTGQEEWLISPSIDLGTGSTPYQVEFDIALTPYSGTAATTFEADDKFYLIISTDNGVTWSDTNILEKWDTGHTPSPTGDYFYYDLTGNGYSGEVKFGLYAESTVQGGADNNVFIDNFAVVPVPTCPRPLSLQLDSVSQTIANLSWINGANDSTWILEYGAPGFTLGTGTTVTSTTNPATITGLTHSTCYDVYLRSFCDVADSSLWIGPIKFCTECLAVSDYCTDFDSDVVGETPLCWKTFINTTSSFAYLETSTINESSAPNCVRMYNQNDASAVMILVAPQVTTTLSGTHRMNVNVRADTTVVVGTMSDPANPGTFVAWDTLQGLSSGSYVNFKIPFTTPPVGHTAAHTYPAILWIPGATYDYVHIDDYCWEEIPSCEKAPAVTILNSGVDSTYLKVGWNNDTTTGASPHVGFMVAYGPPGYDPVSNPAGGDTVNAAFNLKDITGLNPSTEYCVWVKAICANGDSSIWSGPHCGETGCASKTSIPYAQNFTNYTTAYPLGLPSCWEEATGRLSSSSLGDTVAYTNSSWTADGFGNVGTTGAARINLWSTNRFEWLVSPSINLGLNPNQTHLVEFDIAMTDYGNTSLGVVGSDDTLAFLISYDAGITWKQSDILAQWDTSNAPSNTGDHFRMVLRNKTGVVKFGFYATSNVSNEDNDWFIDNFSIKDTVFVGIEENELGNYRIFPNPNTGVFTILNEGGANQSSIKLVDIQGRVVYDEAYYFNSNARKVINLNGLTNGVYVLLIQSEGKLEQHRIVISK